MTISILYNADPFSDYTSILQYINDFSKPLTNDVQMISTEAIGDVINEMRIDFPHVDGLDKASSFKMAGHFLVNFIAYNPIKSKFDKTIIGEDLYCLPNHQNIITAFQMAIDGLDGASIFDKDGNETILNRIQVSSHSYFDIIEALNGVTPNSHYKIATVLLEQMAYKTNPDAQYNSMNI